MVLVIADGTGRFVVRGRCVVQGLATFRRKRQQRSSDVHVPADAAQGQHASRDDYNDDDSRQFVIVVQQRGGCSVFHRVHGRVSARPDSRQGCTGGGGDGGSGQQDVKPVAGGSSFKQRESTALSSSGATSSPGCSTAASYSFNAYRLNYPRLHCKNNNNNHQHDNRQHFGVDGSGQHEPVAASMSYVHYLYHHHHHRSAIARPCSRLPNTPRPRSIRPARGLCRFVNGCRNDERRNLNRFSSKALTVVDGEQKNQFVLVISPTIKRTQLSAVVCLSVTMLSKSRTREERRRTTISPQKYAKTF